MAAFLCACLVPPFLISFCTTILVRRVAPLVGLVDQPGHRKVHVTPTALGGGIAVWAGVVVPLAVANLVAARAAGMEPPPSWIPPGVNLAGALQGAPLLWCVIAGGTLLSIMGLLDDLANLPWKPRLAVQLLVAAGIVCSGVRATVFVESPIVGGAITCLWILVLTNSFNFLDNMDGLSPGIALVASSMFSAVMLTATSEPRWLVGGVMLILAGSLCGFLCFNKPPASIFMGDTGSYFVGLMMACMTVMGTFYSYGESRHVMLAPLCILAIPLYDFCSVILIRLREGRSPFHADKSHFSHRLVELGMPKPAAVLTIHLATLMTGIGALLLYKVEGWGGAVLVIALIACVLAIVAILETTGRRRIAAAEARAAENTSE